MRVVTRTSAPALDIDLYQDAVLRDSREAFARLREAGPVVWLPRHGMYAMGRFDDVRAALRNDAVFRSGEGVAVNRLMRCASPISTGRRRLSRRL